MDWTVAFCENARSLTLVHRRADFRAAPATVARMRDLVAAGKMQFLQGNAVALQKDGERLSGLEVQTADGQMRTIPVDHVFAFFGLHPKLGPIAEWGLEMEKRSLKVDTEKFQTSVPGIFAIGDINSYTGKLKLILSGFHEAALMSQAAFHICRPNEKLRFQYTPSSSNLQKKLGVS